ncbi:hypothetical protein D3C77_507880 [compost metagenome]
MVAERGALGETGGAGGVLDVDRVFRAQAGLAICQGFAADLGGLFLQLAPGQERLGRVAGKAHYATQGRQPFAVEGTGLDLGQLRHQAEKHGVVVRGFEGVCADHPTAC